MWHVFSFSFWLLENHGVFIRTPESSGALINHPGIINVFMKTWILVIFHVPPRQFWAFLTGAGPTGANIPIFNYRIYK